MQDPPQCTICLEELAPHCGRELPCGHSFHAHCISPWAKLHDTCPNCRHPFVVPHYYETVALERLTRYIASRELGRANSILAHSTVFFVLMMLSWHLAFSGMRTPIYLTVTLFLCELALRWSLMWGVVLLVLLFVQIVSMSVLLFLLPCWRLFVMHTSLLVLFSAGVLWVRAIAHRERAMSRTLMLL